MKFSLNNFLVNVRKSIVHPGFVYIHERSLALHILVQYQLTFTCSNLFIETVEKRVNYVQS